MKKKMYRQKSSYSNIRFEGYWKACTSKLVNRYYQSCFTLKVSIHLLKIFSRLYWSIGLRFVFLMTTIDLIDVFCRQLIIGIDPIYVFWPSVPNYGYRYISKVFNILGVRLSALVTEIGHNPWSSVTSTRTGKRVTESRLCPRTSQPSGWSTPGGDCVKASTIQQSLQKYTIPMVKHSASVMIWGCFRGARGRGVLYFLPKNQKMNRE